MEPIRFTMEYRPEDVREIVAAGNPGIAEAPKNWEPGKKAGLQWLSYPVLFVFLLGLLIAINPEDMQVKILLWILLAVYGFMALRVVVGKVLEHRMLRQNEQLLVNGLSYDVTVDDEGIRSSRSDGQRDAAAFWDDIDMVKVTKNFYLLFGQKQLLMSLSRNAMGDGDARFAALLKERLAARKVPVYQYGTQPEKPEGSL